MFDEITGPQLVAAARRGDLRALGTLLGDLVTRLDTLSEAEITFLDGVVAGTVSASKAIVADANGLVEGVAPLKRAYKALSNAELLALAATPVEVIAAPGAGLVHVVQAWRFRTIFVATAIDDAAADGNLILKYAATGTIDSIEADGLIDAAANSQTISNVLTELLDADTDFAAKAVQISNDGAEFTAVGGGDSTAEVEVYYRTLSVDFSA
jgi:hypothetical protein